MYKFEELKVYQKTLDFIDKIYTITKSFPKEEIYGITNQIRRSSVSIACNISEGSGRAHSKEFIHFLRIARGSAFESATIMEISKRQNYLTDEQFKELSAELESISKMINALIKSIS